MRIPGLVAILIACVLGAVLYAVRVEQAPAIEASLPLTPCHLESLAEEVLCGVVEVFEDRDAGTGRRIPIHVAVLPPLRRSAARDPLFVLAGGPGQGARSYAGAVGRGFRAVRRTRAIVLVDLRGTGASAPLTCVDGRDELTALTQGRDLFIGSGAACVSELDGDPRHYTHRNALADLEEVRRRLGYSLVNLWGGSWGTRAALVYALKYPHALRRIVLDGAVDLEMNFPRTAAADAQRAFDILSERCATDPACARAFPDPRRELDELLERLQGAPASVTIRHPRTGLRADVTLTRDAVAEILRVALYTPTDAARVLQLVRSAASGDFAPLAAQHIYSASLLTDDMALGSTMAVLCSEDLPLVAGADFVADARDTAFGPSYAEGWVQRCRDWPLGAPIGIDRHATSRAPALILSGTNDPVTPPTAGEAMARRFPAHQHIVVPGAAHNASFTGCVPDLIAAFLDGRALEASCVNDIPLPAVLVGTAGGRP